MIIIIVDLGHFKAFSVIKNRLESTRIEPLKAYDIVDAHGKLSDKVSDGSGKFGLIGGKLGRKGSGEAHNAETEKKRRIIKLIVKDIEMLTKKVGVKQWYLAAEKSINKQILGNLSSDVVNKMEKNIIADLTGTDKAKLLGRFGII